MDARQEAKDGKGEPDNKEARSTKYEDPEGVDDWDDLTPEEQEERKSDRRFEQITRITDNLVDRFNQDVPEEQRQAAVDNVIEYGMIDPEALGLHDVEADILVATFTVHAERNCLTPVGLSMPQYLAYVSDADQKQLRAAAIRGDWGLLASHAKTVSDYIRTHGDVNAGLY